MVMICWFVITSYSIHYTKLYDLSIGSISGALAVMLGAFGAHGLKEKLSEKMLANWMTGVEYHFYHTFALLVVGLLAMKIQSGLLTASGWSFVAGILLFSGSLYAMVPTGITRLGARNNFV